MMSLLWFNFSYTSPILIYFEPSKELELNLPNFRSQESAYPCQDSQNSHVAFLDE